MTLHPDPDSTKIISALIISSYDERLCNTKFTKFRFTRQVNFQTHYLNTLEYFLNNSNFKYYG